MKALVLDSSIISRFETFEISNGWFGNFKIPSTVLNIKCVVINNITYILSTETFDDNVPVVVINMTGETKVLNSDPNQENVDVFSRITTIGQASFNKNVKIPYRWKFFSEGAYASVNALPLHKSYVKRIAYERSLKNSNDVYIFAVTEKTVDFSQIDKKEHIYDKAKASLTDAILAESPVTIDALDAGILLKERLPQGFKPGESLQYWYDTKLTSDQRSFVDLPYTNPARLRGAAGTGKTLALVVKFIKDGQALQKNGESKKIGFITHSSGSSDMINSIVANLDATGLLYNQNATCQLELSTLYEIANDYLRYEQDGLEPLSIDGYEGKKLQIELIQGILKEAHSDKIFKLQQANISSELKEKWTQFINKGDNQIVLEVMHEFASVLDAEGIRKGNKLSERYTRGNISRSDWLMKLDTIEDREFLLELHQRYRDDLKSMNTISVDQMIADFNSFLDSNRWDQVKNVKAYDALFVDELHLFTVLERQTLHKLVKTVNNSDRPAIFMAYDLKQSPRDVFSQYVDAGRSLFSPSNNLQNSQLIELNEVFRYTPEIAELLRDIDANFPAIDIPGEWGAYAGTTQLENGAIPTLKVYEDELELFKSVFSKAKALARSNKVGGRRIAVLSVSGDSFAKYLTAAKAQYANDFVPILDRDPSSELKHMRKKFVFSMPEYVAGLQFETVFLINVDNNEASIDSGPGQRRNFVSSLYLGASRAEKKLHLSSCKSKGGHSDILNLAISRSSLTVKT